MSNSDDDCCIVYVGKVKTPLIDLTLSDSDASLPPNNQTESPHLLDENGDERPPSDEDKVLVSTNGQAAYEEAVSPMLGTVGSPGAASVHSVAPGTISCERKGLKRNLVSWPDPSLSPVKLSYAGQQELNEAINRHLLPQETPNGTSSLSAAGQPSREAATTQPFHSNTLSTPPVSKQWHIAQSTSLSPQETAILRTPTQVLNATSKTKCKHSLFSALEALASLEHSRTVRARLVCQQTKLPNADVEFLFRIYATAQWTVYEEDKTRKLVQEAVCCHRIGQPLPPEVFVQLLELVSSSGAAQDILGSAANVLIQQVHCFSQMFCDLSWLSEALECVLNQPVDSLSLLTMLVVEELVRQHASSHCNRFWLCPVKNNRRLKLVVEKTLRAAAHQLPVILRRCCELLLLIVHTDSGHDGPSLVRRVHIIAYEIRNHIGELSLPSKTLLLQSLDCCLAFRLVRMLLEDGLCMDGRAYCLLDTDCGRIHVEDAVSLYVGRLVEVQSCSLAEADEYVLFLSTLLRYLCELRFPFSIDVDGLHIQLGRLVGREPLTPQTLQRLRLMRSLESFTS